MLPTSPAPRPEDPFSDFDSYLNREAEPPAQPAAPSVQSNPEPQAAADPFSDFDSYLSRESQKPFLPPPIPGVAEGVEAELQFGNGTRSQPTVMEQLGGVGRAVVTGGQQLLGGLGTALETAGQGMQQPGITGGALAGVPLQAIGEVLSKGGEAYARNTYDIERERQAMAQQSPGWGFAQDVAAQIPQIAAAAATGGGAPALALLGASAAGQGIQQAEAEGATPAEAVAYGATSGLIEAGTERIGTLPLVENMLKREVVGGELKKGAVKRILKAMRDNFGEEVAASIGNDIAAQATYKESPGGEGPWPTISLDSARRAIYSGLVGMGLGGIVSGGTEVANRIGTEAPQQAPPPQMHPPVVEAPPVQEAAPVVAEPIPVPIVEPLPPQPEVVPQAPPAAVVQPEAPTPPQKPPRKRKAGPSPAELDQLQAEAAPVEQAPAEQEAPKPREQSILVADFGGRRLSDVYKNPTQSDINAIRKLNRFEHSDRNSMSEPQFRSLLDAEGNVYVWSSFEGSHEQAKKELESRGVEFVGDGLARAGSTYKEVYPDPEYLALFTKQAPAQPVAPQAAPPVQTVVPQEAQNGEGTQADVAEAGRPAPDQIPVAAEAGRPAPAAVLEETPDALRRQEGNQEGRQEVAPTPPVPATVPEARRLAYRETALDDVEEFLPFGGIVKDISGVYMASTPDLAIGQGKNKGGAILTFDQSKLNLSKVRTKPGMDFVAEKGGGEEFQDRISKQLDYRDALLEVTIPATAPARKSTTRRLPTALNRLVEQHGWTKINNPDGSVTYRRGDESKLRHKVGDSQKVMGFRAKVTAVETVDGVDYELYRSVDNSYHDGALRVFDADSGNTVAVQSFKTYEQAQKEFQKTVDAAKKGGAAAPQGSGIVAGAAAAKPIGPPLERPALTEATPEDAARLVEAAQPIPGPIGEKVQEIGEPSALKSFVQRWFTSRRGLPETARKAMEAREGDIASTRAVAKDLGQSLDRAIYTHVKDLAAQQQKATGVEPDLTTIQDGVWEKANAVLDGAVAPKDSGLPQPILDRLRIFREAIDKGSAEIAAEEGMISDEMKEVFGENAGKYVTRTYLVHQIGGERRIRQLRRGGQAEWNAIRDEISAMPEFDGWTTEQIDGWMENELARFEPGRPTQESEGKPPGTQNLSIYKRRKDIPDPIRRLYGEIKNPAVRAFVTITNIRRNLDTFRMYRAIREGGLKEGWLSEVEKPGFRAMEGSKATAPLQSRRSKKKGTEEEPGGPPRDSLFGKKEILDALRMADDGVRIPVVSWLTGAIKSAKTVYSVQAQVRNIMANPLLLLGGGNLGWAPWKRASLRGSLLEASREFKRGSRADAFADLSNVDMKDLAGAWGRAGKLGVTNTNPDLADIRAMMGAQIDADLPPGHRPLSAKELLSSDPSQMLGVRRGLKFVSEKMQTAYRLGDEFFKFVAWQNETAKIRYYRPELTQDQAEVLAADTVRDILPTDQRSIQFLRMLRQFPALGTFISFVSEIPRNAKNVVKLGVKEVTEGKKAGNKKQMEVGIHRLASFVLATSAVPAIGVALAAAIKQATGLKDEEQDKLEAAARVYLPFYAKNQTLAVMKTGKGKALAFDLSFMDPWAVLKDPILTFFRTGILDEKDLDERLAAAARESLDPYISEGLGLGLMFDLLRGRNARGIELWDPALPPDEKRRAMANYALRGVEPGTLTTARRIGYGIASEIDKARGGEGVKDPVNRREYDPVTELFAIAGMRPLPIDATTQLGFTARAYSDLTQRAGSQYRKEARASAAPEDKPRAEENYRYIYDQGMKELASGVAAARAFGLTDKEIDAILKESRISAEVRKKAMSPENAVLETLETLREKRLKEIEEEVDKERAARKKAAGR